jgi:hypothetical protein
MVSKIIDKSLRTKINLQPSDMVIVNGKSEKNTVEIDMTKDMPTTLTINDIIAMNNQKTFYEYKENGELAYLSGKFSNQKIDAHVFLVLTIIRFKKNEKYISNPSLVRNSKRSCKSRNNRCRRCTKRSGDC